LWPWPNSYGSFDSIPLSVWVPVSYVVTALNSTLYMNALIVSSASIHLGFLEESFGVPQNVKVTITDENERGWSARYRADLTEKECHGIISYNKSEGALYITFMEETD